MAWGFKEWFYRHLEKHHWLFLFFSLPASFLFDLVVTIHHRVRRVMYSAPEYHDQRVLRIQGRVIQWQKQSAATRKKLANDRPNWLSMSTKFFNKDLCDQILIDLYDIISVDEDNLTVRVEPMVTVREITRFLMSMGYNLAVTVENGDATLGGIASGVGMTTHSHKMGLFQETILACDLILADGSLVKATNDNEFSDLFRALPWSHGSLCFVVALDLKIVPVKPYVHLVYFPVRGKRNYCEKLKNIAGALDKDQKLPMYLEAMIFSKEEAVIMVGEPAKGLDFPHLYINSVARWYKPWFYKYVESIYRKGSGRMVEELIPTKHYLRRHERSIFWTLERLIPFGNKLWFRILFGWMLPLKPSFMKFAMTPDIRKLTVTKHVFQDFLLPIAKLEDQIDKAEHLFNIYPILVNACRVYDHGELSGQIPRPRREFICPGSNYAVYNGLGLYGVPGYVKDNKPYNPVRAMRAMTKFTRDLRGLIFLHGDIFMSEDEFEEMYDLKLYDKVRRKYGAEGAFPTLYEKVKSEIDVFQYAIEE